MSKPVPPFQWVAIDRQNPSRVVSFKGTEDWFAARDESTRQLRCSLARVLHHIVAEGESIESAHRRLVRRVEDEKRRAGVQAPEGATGAERGRVGGS